jgi:SAM-dependent methyltransferase
MKTAPIGGLLYSLLHLGGFDGDLRFYSQRSAGRVLEMGCGDGRIAAALCLGAAPLSVLQQQSSQEQPLPTDSSAPSAYVGIELCEPLALKARARLADAPCPTEVVEGDFLAPLPAERTSCFDTVIVSANTLFSVPRHDVLLSHCATALTPGGVLLLDVYNALLWHDSENDRPDESSEEGAGSEEEGSEEETLLVRVQDEEGTDWTVYEREPAVDSSAQTIACAYDFHAAAAEEGEEAGGESATFSETLVHEYLLPEQLVRKLDANGFAIDHIYGGFDGADFDADESEHVVVVARRKEHDDGS